MPHSSPTDPADHSQPQRRSTDRKVHKQMLTVNDVAKLLHQRSRISDEQFEMVIKRGEDQAKRLNSHLRPSKTKKDIYLIWKGGSNEPAEIDPGKPPL